MKTIFEKLASVFLITPVIALLYWVCFSPSFYSTAIGFCEYCK